MAVSTSSTGKAPEPKPSAALQAHIDEVASGVPYRHVPNFLPAGTQAELDATGEATNPFTGERITKAKD